MPTDDGDLIWPGDPLYDDGEDEDEDEYDYDDDEGDEDEDENYFNEQRERDITSLREGMTGQMAFDQYVLLASRAEGYEGSLYAAETAQAKVHREIASKYPKMTAAAKRHDPEFFTDLRTDDDETE